MRTIANNVQQVLNRLACIANDQEVGGNVHPEGGCFSSEFNSKLELGFRLKAALLIAPVMWDGFQNAFYSGTAFFLLYSINTLTP